MTEVPEERRLPILGAVPIAFVVILALIGFAVLRLPRNVWSLATVTGASTVLWLIYLLVRERPAPGEMARALPVIAVVAAIVAFLAMAATLLYSWMTNRWW